MHLRTLRRCWDLGSAALFLAAISAPGLVHLATEDDAHDLAVENRVPAPRPHWPSDLASFTELPRQLEAYHADFVRGRTALIRANHALRLLLLGMTPPGSSTILGPHGWIFFTGNEALEQHRGRRPWSNDMLEHACRILEQRRDALRELGIELLFVVAPDKMSIYPEELPAWALPLAERTPLDDLLRAAESHGIASAILDLRPVLRARKREREIYFPRGTHWNSWGAYYAYRAIAERLAGTRFGSSPSGSSVIGVEELRCGSERSSYDSWGRQWHVPDLLEQDVPYLETPSSFGRKLVRSWWPRVSRDQADPNHGYVTQKPPGSRLLVFHDSFWDALMPLVTAHFASTSACSTYGFDPSLVRAIAPQVVIQLCVERNLWEPFRVDELIDTKAAWIDEAELAATYANPRWGEIVLTRTAEGRTRASGASCGEMELVPLLPGVYASRSPLVGPLRLALFRERGARHLVVCPERNAEAYSFVAPPAGARERAEHERWEGTYRGPHFELEVRSIGGALWCFGSGGVLTHVVTPRPGGGTHFFDEQDPGLEWRFTDRGEGGASLVIHSDLAGLPPVEFHRR